MKKRFTILMVALLAMTSVFASPMNSFQGAVNGQSTSTQVKLDIDPEDVSFYRFGFTSDDEPIYKPSHEFEPDPLNDITLKLNDEKSAAVSTGTNSIYYFIESVEAPTLTLIPGKGLSRNGYKGVIEYKIDLGGGYNNTVSSGEGNSLKIPMKSSRTGIYTNKIPFTITTTTKITPQMASSTETWTDTITLKISKNA